MSSPATFTDYLPNLLPYRSVIISYVIIIHILMQLIYTDTRFAPLEILLKNSDLPVTLLYILSGFLISYMLLKEKTKTGNIQVKAFYKRRFFRIYPVYIFCISLSYIIHLMPQWKHLAQQPGTVDLLKPGQEYLILALLGSHILFSMKENALSLHTWTVGAEENFYLVWAPVLKRVSGFLWIGPVLLISPTIEFILNFVYARHPEYWVKFLLHFNNYFRISTIAIGALGCYLYLYKKEYTLFCRNKLVQYAALSLLLFVIFSGVRFGIFFYEFVGTLFLILVLGNIEPANNPLPLEYKPLRYIGRISYGLYVFHPFCIFMVILLLEHAAFFRDHAVMYFIAVTILSFIFTFVISVIVYYTFERRLYERSSTLLRN